MNKKLKKLVIILLIGIALIVVVSIVNKRRAAPPSGPLASSATVGDSRTLASSIGNPGDFAALLSSVKSITIDTSLFSDPAYRAFRDHPVILGAEPVGRSNPFAPIGSDASASSEAGAPEADVAIQTLQPGKVTSTSAEFAAQVSLNTTAPVSVVFQYGTNDTFGSATPPIALTKSGPALATVTGLAPTTTYYVQAVAVVGSNTITGNTMTFTTTSP